LAVGANDDVPYAIIFQADDNSLKLVEGGDDALQKMVIQFNDNSTPGDTLDDAIKSFRGIQWT